MGREIFEKHATRSCRCELGTYNCVYILGHGSSLGPGSRRMPQRHLIFVLIRLQHALPSPQAVCLPPWKKSACSPQKAVLQDPGRKSAVRSGNQAQSPDTSSAIGIFRFLGHWYEHRAPAHLSAKRRIMCCFCNTGIKALCHNVRFWLMIFIPKVILILTQSLTNPP